VPQGVQPQYCSFQDVFNDTTSIIASIGSGANPAYNGAAPDLLGPSTVHSNGAPRNGALTPVLGAPGQALFNWQNGKGSISGCSACHAGIPSTNAHGVHFTKGFGNCGICTHSRRPVLPGRLYDDSYQGQPC